MTTPLNAPEAPKVPKATRRRKPHTSPTARVVNDYIEGVLNGTVITGQLIRLVVTRHLLDLQ